MIVYATSKNSGPTWAGSDPVTLVYLGTSLEDAKKAVGDFAKYHRDKFIPAFSVSYSAIPRSVVDREIIEYYMADGWWYTIVKFELN